MLPERHMVYNILGTQFIRRLVINFSNAYVFSNAYTGPCEARVLRLNIFLEEDRVTEKIPTNYAPATTYGVKYSRYSVYPTPGTLFFRSPCFFGCIHRSM